MAEAISEAYEDEQEPEYDVAATQCIFHCVSGTHCIEDRNHEDYY